METAIRFSRIADEAAAADPGDLVMVHVPTAMRLAHWYHKRTQALPLEDLQGEALLALVETAARCSDDIKTSFDRYVSTVIVARMKEAVAANDTIQMSWTKRYDKRTLESIDRREMTDAELRERLGWTQKRLDTTRQALSAAAKKTSLDEPIGDTDLTLGGLIADPGPGPDEIVINSLETTEERAWLTHAIADLPAAARNVISLRFGIPVPSIKTLPLRDVIRAGLSMSAATRRGMRRLKEARRNERGDMPTVVRDNPTTISDGCRADHNFIGEAGRNRAFNVWRLYKSGPDAPPAFQSTGAVGN